MRRNSVYVIECVCGETIEREDPVGRCRCGREYEVRNWGVLEIDKKEQQQQ